MYDEYLSRLRSIEQYFPKLPGNPEVRVSVDTSGRDMVHMSLDFYGYDSYAAFANFYTNGKPETKLEVDHHLNRINYVSYAQGLAGLPPIKRVIFNDPATIVLWGDNTKTVVKCQEGDIYDPEKGLYAAMVKKALGNKSNFNNVINKWLAECKEGK